MTKSFIIYSSPDIIRVSDQSLVRGGMRITHGIRKKCIQNVLFSLKSHNICNYKIIIRFLHYDKLRPLFLAIIR